MRFCRRDLSRDPVFHTSRDLVRQAVLSLTPMALAGYCMNHFLHLRMEIRGFVSHLAHINGGLTLILSFPHLMADVV